MHDILPKIGGGETNEKGYLPITVCCILPQEERARVYQYYRRGRTRLALLFNVALAPQHLPKESYA